MGKDKLHHGMAGATGVTALHLLGLPPLVAVAITIIVLVLKEVIDSMGYGTPDFWDLFCGLVGVLAACVVLSLAYMSGRKDK